MIKVNNKRLDRLVSEVLAIEEEDAKSSGNLGYMARVFTQVTMPHSKVNGKEYERSNGSFKLSIMTPFDIGIPYGAYPRLLMSWITSEAVKKRDPVVSLGHTLSEFMAQIGLIPSGGRWGTISRLKEQMTRLFSSTISCEYERENYISHLGIKIAKSYDLWWDPKSPDQASLWQSTVTLNSDFFDEIIDRPIPVDMRVLKAIKQSPMKLDIYCWLTYRMSYLSKKTEIPWELLSLQFGANYTRTRDFKVAFLKHLGGVLPFYDAAVEEGKQGLILKPTKPHIPHRKIITSS